MKPLVLWFLVLGSWLGCSCTSYDHMAVAKNGNMVHDRILKLGGAISARSSDGSSMVSDDQRSFQDAMGAVGLAVGGWVNKANTASNNALTATQNTNALKAQQSKNALEAAKIKATPTILTEGQTAVFPP